MGGKGSGRKLGSKWKLSKQAVAARLAAVAEKPLEVDPQTLPESREASGNQPGTPHETRYQSGLEGTGESPGETFFLMPDSRPSSEVLGRLNRGEKRAFKRRNQEWVAEHAHDYLLNLLARARQSGDIRGEIVVIKDLMDRSEGTARQEPEPPSFELSKMIERVAEAVKDGKAQSPMPLLPAAPEALQGDTAKESAPSRNDPPKGDQASTGESEASPRDWSKVDEPPIPPEVLKEIGPPPVPGSDARRLWDTNFRILTQRPAILAHLENAFDSSGLNYDPDYD